MSPETVDALCRSLVRMRVGRVELSGKGEPMAHPQFGEIVRIIKKAGLRCSLVTNGTLGTPDLARTIVELRLDRLNVSLNAASPRVFGLIAGKQMWEQAVGFLRAVLAHRCSEGARRPWTRASYVLCRDNVGDTDRMVDLCCELPLDEISWAVMGELPETTRLRLDADEVSGTLTAIPRWARRLDAHGVRHNLPQLAGELKLRVAPGGRPAQENPLQRAVPCYEGWMFAVVGPDGTVVPCCPCENVRLGNINDDDFSNIWWGARYKEFRSRSLAMRRGGDPICWECFTTCNRALDNARIDRMLGPLRPH